MEPCRIEWITIPAPDIESAENFYGNVFGFVVSTYNERYRVFKGGNIGGGLDQDLDPGSGGIGFSITVPDIDHTIRLIVEFGGRLLGAPWSLGPGLGYCARFADPNGNVLELYSSSPPEGFMSQ